MNMNKEKITATISEVLVEQLGVRLAEVVPTARVSSDLGADSLDRIEIIMALEEEFNVRLDDARVPSNPTVTELVELVASVLGVAE